MDRLLDTGRQSCHRGKSVIFKNYGGKINRGRRSIILVKES